MPRTSAVELPGCPSIRALTFDVLGLVKVVEARDKQGGVAKVVEIWGTPDSSKCVLAASINDRKLDPVFAVARKCGLIEVIGAVNGDIRVSFPNVSQVEIQPEEDPVSGLHLFRKRGSELSPRSCTLLTCSTKGYASLRTVEIPKSPGDSFSSNNPTNWNVCGAGSILCSKVDESESFGLFGGKGVEVNVWDIEKVTKIWTAKSPAKNSLDIFTPTWFTSATFLSKDDHRKLVTGTNNHQVRLYDISVQRRPVISIDFLKTPIKALAEDIDGNTIYVGNGSGDLASVDIRTGKVLGCFLGKCSGSIKSIARHPQLPVIASCGYSLETFKGDYIENNVVGTSYLYVYSIYKVFLKQHLTNFVFDSQFGDEEVTGSASYTPQNDSQESNEMVEINKDEVDLQPVKRKKKTSKEHSGSKKQKPNQQENGTIDGDFEPPLPVIQKKTTKGHRERKKVKSKKKGRVLEDGDNDES